jgi:hypothetical protein
MLVSQIKLSMPPGQQKGEKMVILDVWACSSGCKSNPGKPSKKARSGRRTSRAFEADAGDYHATGLIGRFGWFVEGAHLDGLPARSAVDCRVNLVLLNFVQMWHLDHARRG